METATRLPSPASVLEPAPRKQMAKTRRRRIPVLGALIEPAHSKPKTPPAAASDGHVETENSGLPLDTATAEPQQPVELGVTTKPKFIESSNAAKALAMPLLQNRDNVGVRRPPRKTALQMWDETDARKAEEKIAE